MYILKTRILNILNIKFVCNSLSRRLCVKYKTKKYIIYESIIYHEFSC